MTPKELAHRIVEEVERFVGESLSELRASSSMAHLLELEGRLTGRRSPFVAWKRSLADLEPIDRPRVGQILNRELERLKSALGRREDELRVVELKDRLHRDRLDLSELVVDWSPGHLHLVTQIRDELEEVFLGMGYEIAEGPEIETDWYNFGALNMPKHHSARSIQDSFYLEVDDSDSWLLRSQTSPVQIRLLERGELPLYAVAPGRVYRRDTADARHLPVFHQIEGIAVDEGVSFSDLKGTIETFVRAIFGDSVVARLRPAYFPFTEPSAEFEITCTLCAGEGCRTCSQTGWIELGGCGMVHPAIFRATSVDAARFSGFAFGFGLERLAIMRHGIEDIRSLIENDVRFLRQF